VTSASGWRVIRGAPVRSVIVIAPGETFAPPPAWAKPKLDGVQAWDKSFLGRGKGSSRRIPADISYQLGLLTVPPSVTDVLACGYSSPPGRCPPPIGGIAAPGSSPAPAPSPRGRCIGGTFINADDASNPAGTRQRLDTPTPSPSPTPVTVLALRPGGFVSSDLERYSPRRLVVQGPLSTIQWTFRAGTCSIDLYWFSPPQLQRGQTRAPCPWRQRFTLDIVGGWISDSSRHLALDSRSGLTGASGGIAGTCSPTPALVELAGELTRDEAEAITTPRCPRLHARVPAGAGRRRANAVTRQPSEPAAF
jgi:hypothetical protein